MLLGSVLVLYWVHVKRKRKETFVILLPVCFILCSAFAIPSFLIKLSVEESAWIIPLAAANIFFSLIGYWFFAAELLRTSLILPKLFTEAKLEWMLQDIKSDDYFPYSSRRKQEVEERDRAGWDMAKLQASINCEGPYKVRLPETFNQFQNVIIDLKDSVRIINKRISGMNILMVIFTAGFSAICQMNLYIYYAAGMGVLLLFTSFVFLYAIYTIWDLIQGIGHAYPNERFILVKGIIFFTYTVLMLVGYGMLIYIASSRAVETRKSYLNLLKFSCLYFLISITCNLFTSYTVFFMLYMLVKITGREANFELKDTILGRKIPQVVYINNLRLLKSAVE